MPSSVLPGHVVFVQIEGYHCVSAEEIPTAGSASSFNPTFGVVPVLTPVTDPVDAHPKMQRLFSLQGMNEPLKGLPGRPMVASLTHP